MIRSNASAEITKQDVVDDHILDVAPAESTSKNGAHQQDAVPEPTKTPLLGGSEWMDLQGRNLYDREQQQIELSEAYDRSIYAEPNYPQREIVLITGASGTGKTALAYTLKKSTAKNGYMVSVKFDQLRKFEGNSAFVAAFSDFATQVIERNDQSRIWRQIEDELETVEWELLLESIPALKRIVGRAWKGDQSLITKGIYAKGRFRKAFCCFIKAISSSDHPFVLFLDDMQWSDQASLEIFSALASESDIRGFMLLGTCRDNEVNVHDPLSAVLRELEDDKVIVTEIHVSNLSEKAVSELISDVLSQEPAACQSLTNVIVRRTGGNIFFVMQLLQALKEEGHIKWQNNGWTWEAESLSLAVEDTDVETLIIEKMRRLDEKSQQFLVYAACLGAEIDELLLYKSHLVDVASSTTTVVEKGFMKDAFVSNAPLRRSRIIRFVHDSIQKAAYSLLPSVKTPEAHLNLGRRLWRNLSETELTDNLFLVVHQLCLGADLIESESERHDVAFMCLAAGQMATRTSSFDAALSFFEKGASLLGRRPWRDDYDLSLELYNAVGEVAFAVADFEKVDTSIKEVLSNARSFDDKLRAYTTQVYSLGAKNELQEAIDLGLDVLARLGESFPKRFSRVHINLSFLALKKELEKMSEDDILSLPMMQDPDKLAAMRLLNLILTYAFTSRQDLAPLVGFRALQLCLKHGLCGISAFSFSFFALVLSGQKVNMPEEGYRYGQLALRILDKYEAREWESRNLTVLHGLVYQIIDPINKSLHPIRHAHRLGLATGDIEFSCLGPVFLAGLYFASGLPIKPFLPELRSHLDFIKLYKQHSALALFLPWFQFFVNWTGTSSNHFVLTGEAMNERTLMNNVSGAGNVTARALVLHLKAILAYYSRDCQSAELLMKQYRKCKQRSTSPQAIVSAAFMEALTCAPKRKHQRIVKRNLKVLEQYARYQPYNAKNKVALVNAEVLASAGKIHQALAHYDVAIRTAENFGIISEHALAHERAGLALRSHGRPTEATEHFCRAQALYEKWGAQVKVDQLRPECL